MIQLPAFESDDRTAGVLHRIPAAVKAGTTVFLLVVIAVIPRDHPGLLLLPCAAVVALVIAGRIPPGILLKRLAAFELLAITTSVLALFQPGGWGLFWMLLAKATLSLAAAVVLSLTVPFMQLLQLMRRLHLPHLLVTTIALLYRYLFVLSDQASRMARARASRTFVPGKRRAWVINSGVVGTLAVRSVERAEHVYNAMRARGWR